MAKKNKATTAEAAVSAPKFTIAKLRQNCMKLFGVTSSTFDGATLGLNGEYTVEEIKTAIEKWRKKEVK